MTPSLGNHQILPYKYLSYQAKYNIYIIPCKSRINKMKAPIKNGRAVSLPFLLIKRENHSLLFSDVFFSASFFSCLRCLIPIVDATAKPPQSAPQPMHIIIIAPALIIQPPLQRSLKDHCSLPCLSWQWRLSYIRQRLLLSPIRRA